MNYGELKAAWNEWSHRNDLSDTVVTNIQSMTTARLGRDLRTDTNTQIENITLTNNAYTLPASIKEIQGLRDAAGNNYEYVAPSLFAPESVNLYQYTIIGNQLKVNSGGSLELTYYIEPGHQSHF